MAVKSVHLGGHPPANPALPGHPSGCNGAEGCAPSCPPPPAKAFIPATDRQLEEAVDHADLVEDLGVAGAPGAAYAIALITPAVVFELRLLRGKAPAATSTVALSEQLWRDRALRAEQRASLLGVEARKVTVLRAAGEELLLQLSDERGTREALDRLVGD